MPPLPAELQQAVDRAFAMALRTASDRRLTLWHRFRAASVAGALIYKATADERMRADLVGAVARSTDRPAVAGRLAEAAVALDRRDPRMAASLLRVVSHAHGVGRHQALVELLTAMVGISEFGPGDVAAEWVEQAATVCDGWEHLLARLLHDWIRRFGGDHEGIRAAIRLRPRAMLEDLPIHLLLDAHAAVPTPDGWLLLADLAVARAEYGDVELPDFEEDRREPAVATLAEALAKESSRRSRRTLMGWLAELTQEDG